MDELRREDAIEAGRRLKLVRTALGLTQQEVAEKCGVDRGYLGEIEIGKMYPSSNILKQLKDAFKISIDWLMFGEGEMFQQKTSNAEPTAALLPNDIGEAVELMKEMSTLERRLFLALLRIKRDETAEDADRAAKKPVRVRGGLKKTQTI